MTDPNALLRETFDYSALADWLEERAHSIRRTEADMKMYQRCIDALRTSPTINVEETKEICAEVRTPYPFPETVEQAFMAGWEQSQSFNSDTIRSLDLSRKEKA